ncbi:hypothetical protein [Nitrosospira sp. Nsp13]|uniref:hypothetical protein n=1 Tax=Nitrosospira sp. Nsp13 TaxID=1855332 RepID=UPI0011131400|nr:hypothetical protein [Nitrosospira sp. Nsp13]
MAYEDVEGYLHALHAPSRNATMREISLTEAELNSQTELLTAKRETPAKTSMWKNTSRPGTKWAEPVRASISVGHRLSGPLPCHKNARRR